MPQSRTIVHALYHLCKLMVVTDGPKRQPQPAEDDRLQWEKGGDRSSEYHICGATV